MQKSKQLHNSIKPEHMQFGKWYAFSYNPIDQPSSLQQLEDWQRSNIIMFNKMYNIDVQLYPEFSSQGRWHYHGIIRVRDPLFYIQDLQTLKLYGSFEMDTISDIQEWFLYCTKNMWMCKDMFELFTSLPYVLTTLIQK